MDNVEKHSHVCQPRKINPRAWLKQYTAMKSYLIQRQFDNNLDYYKFMLYCCSLLMLWAFVHIFIVYVNLRLLSSFLHLCRLLSLFPCQLSYPVIFPRQFTLYLIFWKHLLSCISTPTLLYPFLSYGNFQRKTALGCFSFFLSQWKYSCLTLPCQHLTYWPMAHWEFLIFHWLQEK